MDFSDELELAYLAGFFDGEGCIVISEYTNPVTSKRPGYQSMRLRIFVGNTNLDVLQLFVSRFGGSINCKRVYGNRKQLWTWSAATREAASALSLMLPYLTVKSEQAEIAAEFQSTMGQWFGLTDDMIGNRRALREAILILNNSGRTHYKPRSPKVGGRSEGL